VPTVPIPPDSGPTANNRPAVPSPPAGSGIQELTDAEAAAMEVELERTQRPADASPPREKTEEEERTEVYEAIQELRKVCNGNLGAVWLAQAGKEKECVEVCTEG
jgi:hypothetical protein